MESAPQSTITHNAVIEFASDLDSHPHLSPRERRAHKKKACPAQRDGQEILEPADNAENPIYQGDLAPAAKTVRDVSKRNDPATRRTETGKIRGICSPNVAEDVARMT
jgi:hypothetical protein